MRRAGSVGDGRLQKRSTARRLDVSVCTHDAGGVPWRTLMVAGSAGMLRWLAAVPWLYNLAATAPGLSRVTKGLMGFAARRSLPPLPPTTLRGWWRRRGGSRGPGRLGRVHLFCDEFTDTLDAAIGIQTVELLEQSLV